MVIHAIVEEYFKKYFKNNADFQNVVLLNNFVVVNRYY